MPDNPQVPASGPAIGPELVQELKPVVDWHGLLTKCPDPQMQKIASRVKKAANIASVILHGPTGAGKEVVARALQQCGDRSGEALVIVNCAAIPHGLFESELFGHKKGSFTGAERDRKGAFLLADKGTLFLDEIGELHLELQAKLLRAIDGGIIRAVGSDRDIETNVRLIVASNRNLQKMVEKNWFRADLYYRLNLFPITIPPLRERAQDIPHLAKFFLEQYSNGTGTFSSDGMAKICAYSWPGNVRELSNTLRTVWTTLEEGQTEIRAEDLSDLQEPKEDAAAKLAKALKKFCRRTKDLTLDQRVNLIIRRVLEEEEGNVAQVAHRLDIGKATVRSKMKKE
ncbi:MAG: sigma-54 dependent transcriptional regulator [Candidatus Pacebacteria bacterium]|nr:sigma-54 dependent transcriptional regulator [Candidatus Paceibacterota bacterium]